MLKTILLNLLSLLEFHPENKQFVESALFRVLSETPMHISTVLNLMMCQTAVVSHHVNGLASDSCVGGLGSVFSAKAENQIPISLLW